MRLQEFVLRFRWRRSTRQDCTIFPKSGIKRKKQKVPIINYNLFGLFFVSFLLRSAYQFFSLFHLSCLFMCFFSIYCNPVTLFFFHMPLVVMQQTKVPSSSRWESFRIHSLDAIFEIVFITWYSRERPVFVVCDIYFHQQGRKRWYFFMDQ